MLSQLPNLVITKAGLTQWQAILMLTFSQSLLEEVMLGLELGDEIPPFQIFLQFLKEERKKNIFEELKFISQIFESNKPRNQKDSKRVNILPCSIWKLLYEK